MRFPRQLVPLSVVATQVVAFAAMTAIVLVLVALVVRPESRDDGLARDPGRRADRRCFVAGLSLAVASLNAVFRDVEFVVAAALLPWFFLTPILYQLEDLPGRRRRTRGSSTCSTGATRSRRRSSRSGRRSTPASCRRRGDLLYLVVATVVALALGALVFSAVDDRIASEA